MKTCMRAVSVVLVLSCVVGTVVAADADQAAEEQQAQQLQAVAVAKAKAEAAVNAMLPLADPVKSGYSVLNADIADQYNKAIPPLQKFIADESVKAFVEQNVALLQKARVQLDLLSEEWTKYTGKVYPVLNACQVDAQSWALSASQTFAAVSALENTWKTAKMDVLTLKPVYEAIEAQARKVAETLKTVLADHKQELKKWQDLAAASRAVFATTEPAAKPAAEPAAKPAK